MVLPPSQEPTHLQLKEAPTTPPSMSAVAIQAPSLLPSPRDMMWESRRGPELLSRPRPEPVYEKVELPSIRQAVPEIDQVRSVRPQAESRPGSASYSPVSLAPSHEYIPSPSLRKRRRLSADDDLDTRDQMAARLHRSPPRPYQNPSTTGSPKSASRRASVLSMPESWASSTRTSPHTAPRGPPTISPPFHSSSITRSEWRPQLPSLPALTFDRAPVPAPRAPASWSEYGFDAASRASIQPLPLQSISPTDSTPTYPPASTYAYQQPRGLSYSGPPTGHTSPHSQAPFSTIHPSGFVGYPYPVDAGDMGGDSKQRKRRGNLPKETTDTLRAWFREHLVHPYPSEEEKQRMMKATGLQMNQISNWFINARRRHLPNMMNTARAEAGARAAAGEGKGLEGAGKGDADAKSEPGDGKGERAARPRSEGVAGSYDEDYAALGRQHSPQGMMKRESI